jgi:hypothetical protein
MLPPRCTRLGLGATLGLVAHLVMGVHCGRSRDLKWYVF